MEPFAITDKNINDCVKCYINKETDNPLYQKLPPKMGDWDVSMVKNVSGLFSGLVDFNEDISEWDLAIAEDLSYMFAGCTNFNCDLSKWFLDNARNTSYMFAGCEKFTSDLSNWYVGYIRNASHMFDGCKMFSSTLVKKSGQSFDRFNKKQNKMITRFSSVWDLNRIQDMSYMFQGCESLNADLSSWSDIYAKKMEGLFKGCKNFDCDISKWNVEEVENMKDMFYGCSKFNCDLSRWSVLRVKDMTKKDIPNFYAGSKISSDKAPYFEPIDETESEKSYFSDDNVVIQQRPYMYYKCKQYRHIGYDKMTICDAAFLYQRHFDSYINALCRGQSKLTNKNLLRFLYNVVRIFDNYCLGPAPRITQAMVDEGKNIVYRGEQSLCENGLCRQGVMTGYTSTSTSLTRAGNVFASISKKCCLYQCVLEVGMPYIDIDALVGQSNIHCGISLVTPGREFEYLLPRGIKFIPSELLVSKLETHPSYRSLERGIQTFGINVVYDPNYIENNPIFASPRTSFRRTRTKSMSSLNSTKRRTKSKSLSRKALRMNYPIRTSSSI